MRLFGTDGIRGNAAKFPFDNNTLEIIGYALAKNLNPSKSKKPFLILRDTRQSGARIEKALAGGVIAAGSAIVSAGVLPTPAASVILKTAKNKYAGAVVISASHNPYQDNGIKIFGANGLKLSDATEAKIEKTIAAQFSKKTFKSSAKIKIKRDTALSKIYENFIINLFSNISLKGRTVVLDCANGAVFKIAPKILKNLGASVVAINNKPNGKNINVNCGATKPEACAETVKKLISQGLSPLGLSFDGDGDRLICVDERGTVRDGDYYLAVMAKSLKANKQLKANALVTTVMANIGLVKEMKAAKISLKLTKVGDRYVLEEMLRIKAALGGEQSGHIIFNNILPTGDGLIAAVELIKHLVKNNTTLFKETQSFQKYPQVLINTKVAAKPPLDKLPKSKTVIKKFEKTYGDEGRVLVRYSGTENLLRVMIEGKNISQIKKDATTIAEIIASEIEEAI
ncbi:MAG: phosphoglucosamine mutase [Elusimicrobia bacterium]|nr:phosphoglucosamine mutase [Elusimicrobiota bacterium]